MHREDYRAAPGPARVRRHGMIEELLPPDVVALEAFDDPPGLQLHPDEAACVAGAVDSRRREFATGRYLARTGLTRLGLAPAGIPRGERGAPCWPDGVVGSITHCAGYRAAAVGRATHLHSVGIDAEPHGPSPHGVLELVATSAERTRLADLAVAVPATAWDRLLFSAKESVYKAWFPLARSFLDFVSADVVFDLAAATFVARLLEPGPLVAGERLRHLSGRFAVRDGLVVTAVTLLVRGAPLTALEPASESRE